MFGKKIDNGDGFTLAEVVVGITVFAIVALSMLGLFTSLVNSAFIAKQKAIAATTATNQIEYLKSLPYDSLAVAGGSIYSTNPLPATTTSTTNGMELTVKTSINYIDEAYDGCASYPNLTLKQLYCRNYPPPSGAPAIDANPQDYKIIHVSVRGKSGIILAEVDTQVSARVAETASTTGALFVTVIDGNGNPVSGATASVTNATITPNVNVSDSTDSNGVAIFYGLPPDSGTDYIVTAAATGSSSLTTIPASGSLQPNYLSQKILSQQSSYVTLTIKPMGDYSLLLETTDTAGAPLSNVRIYAKGGYKKYTASSDTSYYYDNMTPSDARPTTDGAGLVGVNNLVPGTYVLCGDDGSSNCRAGSTTYYLAAALPYISTNSFNPIIVPTYISSSPPAETFAYGSNEYLQKARLILTTNPTFPRISTMNPTSMSLASGTTANFTFQIYGRNLPCNSVAASCATTVRFTQASSTFNASCTGDNSGLQLNCSADLTGVVAGPASISITSGGNTLNLPATPQMGGLYVTP